MLSANIFPPTLNTDTSSLNGNSSTEPGNARHCSLSSRESMDSCLSPSTVTTAPSREGGHQRLACRQPPAPRAARCPLTPSARPDPRSRCSPWIRLRLGAILERAGQPTKTFTISPPGLNVRCTVGFPGPSTVTVTTMVSPSSSVPDAGVTATPSCFVWPAGTETDQLTGPPDAVRVIVPEPGEVMSSSAGLTVSVPAATSPGDSDADAETPAATWSELEVEVGRGMTSPAEAPALTVATTRAVGVAAARGRCVAGARM